MGNRSEKDIDLETGCAEEVRKVGAELGEDRVTPFTAGMGDAWGFVLNGAVGMHECAGVGVRNARQHGDGEDVAAARHEVLA